VQASLSEKAITQIQGNAAAQQKLILANATATAANMTIGATAEAYEALKTDLGIGPKSNLSKYIFFSDLQTADSTPILYNVNKTIIHI